MSKAMGAVHYMVNWPLAAPRDAYRAGAKYNFILGVIALLIPGLPMVPLRFFAGIFIATANWVRA